MELPDLNELDDIIVTIEEEDGTETECQIICMFEYDDKAYAALTPTDENIAEAYLFGLTIEEQGDEMEFTIENIDDPSVLEEVSKVFESIMEEASDDEDLPEGVTIEPASDPGTGSHVQKLPGDDDDAYWDQFINKKLEEL